MNIVVSVIFGAIAGYVVYLILGLVPFLAPFATVGGLISFLLIVLGGYSSGWNLPRR